MGCRRPLDTRILAEDFARHVLKKVRDYEEPAAKIVDAELALKKLEDHPTSTHEDYRDHKYRTNDQRKLLHDQILAELIKETRLVNDDEIVLGVGGAKPQKAKCERIAYIVTGAPASGKSKVAARLADDNGAYVLDSDYAKRKFPEYYQYPGGASLVHQESDSIVFGAEDSLFEYCLYENYNIVIPLVGRTYKSLIKICRRIMGCGYTVHIVNVVLDRYECVLRAYNRFEATNRYVPLSYIFDEVGNEPELVYFRMKRAYELERRIGSFSQVSTNVPKESLPEILEATTDSPIHSWKKEGRGCNENSKAGC